MISFNHKIEKTQNHDNSTQDKWLFHKNNISFCLQGVLASSGTLRKATLNFQFDYLAHMFRNWPYWIILDIFLSISLLVFIITFLPNEFFVMQSLIAYWPFKFWPCLHSRGWWRLSHTAPKCLTEILLRVLAMMSCMMFNVV